MIVSLIPIHPDKRLSHSEKGVLDSHRREETGAHAENELVFEYIVSDGFDRRLLL